MIKNKPKITQFFHAKLQLWCDFDRHGDVTVFTNERVYVYGAREHFGEFIMREFIYTEKRWKNSNGLKDNAISI